MRALIIAGLLRSGHGGASGMHDHARRRELAPALPQLGKALGRSNLRGRHRVARRHGEDRPLVRRRGDRAIAWENDFSKARNRSLDMASQPWILVIDADEELDQATGPKLREVANSSGKLAFLLSREDLRADAPAERIALARIMRRDPNIRFSRPVHESIMDSLFTLGTSALDDSGVRLLHYGYLPEALRERDKHGRNLAILRTRCLEAPGDLYSRFKLAVTLPRDAGTEKLAAFEGASAMARELSAEKAAELPFLATLCDAHAAWLASRGELASAIEIADQGRARAIPRLRTSITTWRFWPAPRATPRTRSDGSTKRSIGHIPLKFGPTESTELAVKCWVSLLALSLDSNRPTRRNIDARVSRVPAVQVGELRRRLFEGRVEEASNGLAPLLESDFHDDEVKLFGGELAWAQRDFDTAHAVWSLTHQETDAGHRARVWLALLALLRGHPAPMPAPLAM